MFTLSSPPRAPPIFSLPDMSMTPSNTRTPLFNFASAPNTPQHQQSHTQTQPQTTPSRLRASPHNHTFTLSPSGIGTGIGSGSGSGHITENTPKETSKPETYAHRYLTTISNPLRTGPPRAYTTSASPSARTARRNLFLNRIKQDRDAGRFEARGEQLVLMEGVAEQKQWGEAMRRRAEMFGGDEYEYGIEGQGGAVSEDELRALDEYLAEEQAMEMGMGMMGEGDGEGGHPGRDERTSFSDDEYDDIFMDLADRIPPSSSGQDMDMSG